MLDNRRGRKADRVCQQALKNRLEPIFDPLFDDANFGYRVGRSTKDALRKVWREIEEGNEWIIDADLRDFFGSVDHEKLMTLVAQRRAYTRKFDPPKRRRINFIPVGQRNK